MVVLAMSSNSWDSMSLLLPYLFATGLMGIVAAFGWEAGSRLSGESLVPMDSDEAQAHTLREYSVGMLVLFNFLTLGGFSFVWLSRLHGKLPKIRSNDPTSGKAIGLALIPIFDFYWIAYSFSRLAQRINLQRDTRSLDRSALSGPLAGMIVCVLLTMILALSLLGKLLNLHEIMPLAVVGVLPIVGCWMFVAPMACWYVQSSINSLCQGAVVIDEEDATAEAAVDAEEESESEPARVTEVVNMEDASPDEEPTVMDAMAPLEAPADGEAEEIASDDIETLMLDASADEPEIDETLDFLADEET